jgi:hypothetical protein
MPILEKKQPFSQSRLWQMQRDYFSAAGVEAWRSGAVPHYATSNPAVGRVYAELALALLRDLALRGQQGQPVYLLELGAGHGRLCYHFFKHFEKYYEHSALPLPPFCYVLSDFSQANLLFWRGQPRLQPYLKLGWLDIAHFDAETSSELALQYSGRVISAGSLAQPLIVVANYFFDTIPQELFRVRNGSLAHSLVTLNCKADPASLSPAELIRAVKLSYSYRPAPTPVYPDDPDLDALLEDYRQQLTDTHLLFPHIGLRCLQRLQALAPHGLALLSADKGEHLLTELDGRRAPGLVTHGSFSLNVNYHAFGASCAQHGGLALFPDHQHASLDLGCLLFMPQPESYVETTNAYLRFVNDYGPDDYFSLQRLIEPRFAELTVLEILSTLRLSAHDAKIFAHMLPRLYELLPEISNAERWDVLRAVQRVWDTYYPLGEDQDIAFALGQLLFALAFYPEARFYFEMSLKIYGENVATLYNVAVCHANVGETAQAAAILTPLRAQHPDDEALQALGAVLEESTK